MKKKLVHIAVVFILIFIIAVIMGVSMFVERYTPTKERESLYTYFETDSTRNESEAILFLNDEKIDCKAILTDEGIYLPYELVKEKFNGRFYWDESAGQIVFTTPTEVYKITPGSKTYTIDGAEASEEYEIFKNIQDILYMNIEYAKAYSDFIYTLYEEPNRLMMYNSWEDREYLLASREAPLRILGGIKSPILVDIAEGEKLILIEEMEEWACVQTLSGIKGYTEIKNLGDKAVETPQNPDYTAPDYTNISKDYKINMAFHQVGGYLESTDLEAAMSGVSGVNTISPTWFFLSDNDGSVASLATHSYVEKAHSMGLEVWGLVENMTYDVSTYQTLSNMASRENLVSNIIAYALEYNLDGINVDFEEVSFDAEDAYIQFIRELSIECRANNLVLSIDNYVPSASSAHYNRTEQGIVADYIIIMGYDEHYAGMSESGSTASISFVENGIVNTLNEVPAEKVINAIPFYTRVFKQTPEAQAGQGDSGVLVEDPSSEYGRYLLSSQAVSMGRAEELLVQNGVTPVWNEALGQYYGEYEANGCKYLVWLEESTSIGLKMQLIKDYGLAGVAEWSLGLAKNSIWETISSYLE